MASSFRGESEQMKEMMNIKNNLSEEEEKNEEEEEVDYSKISQVERLYIIRLMFQMRNYKAQLEKEIVKFPFNKINEMEQFLKNNLKFTYLK